MKKFRLVLVFLSMITFEFPLLLSAQDESDDLYFNSSDSKKNRAQTKVEPTNPPRKNYTYPSPSPENNNDFQNFEQDERFSNPNYSNKYIEAEKNEGKQGNIQQNATTINNYYGSNNNNTTSQNGTSMNQSNPDLNWYRHNNFNLRRRARGSRWNISPVISWNSWSGWGLGFSTSWHSGWNSWYGWNSPFYNNWGLGYMPFYSFNNWCWPYYGFGGYGWNNYMYGGFGHPYNGFGWGFGSPFYGGFGYPYYGYNGFGWQPYYGIHDNYRNRNFVSRTTGPIYDRSSPSNRPVGNTMQGTGATAPAGRYAEAPRNNNTPSYGGDYGTRGGGNREGAGNSNTRIEGQPQNPYTNRVAPRENYNYSVPAENSTPQSTQRTEYSNSGGNVQPREYNSTNTRPSENYSRPRREPEDNYQWRGGSGGGNDWGTRGGGFGGGGGGSMRMGGGGGGFGGGGGGRIQGGR
jgi:hypothetical protein